MKSLVCRKCAKGSYWGQKRNPVPKGPAMFEATTDARTRDAMRNANQLRSDYLRRLFTRGK